MYQSKVYSHRIRVTANNNIIIARDFYDIVIVTSKILSAGGRTVTAPAS